MPFIDFDSAINFSLVVAPIATGFTELIKRNFTLPKNVLPFISIGIGVVVAIFYPANFDWITRILGGVLAGLAGVGTFEAFIKNLKNVKTGKTLS